MRILSAAAASKRVDQLSKRGSQFGRLESQVRKIVEDVRRNGDRALHQYAAKWDGLADRELRVPNAELEAAWAIAPPRLRSSLRQASANIRRFCKWQRPQEWRRKLGGMSLGQVVRPLQSVGCYVPGGRHPLVSSLLMTVIPAEVAGVPEIRVVSPHPSPALMAAAHMLGVHELYRVGGAHAIAALAYGTKAVPRVDKIVGPGNQYVAVAKSLVAGDCAIDFYAGPTEIVIVAATGRPAWVAADIVAQAEHDPDARSILITWSRRFAERVASAVNVQ